MEEQKKSTGGGQPPDAAAFKSGAALGQTILTGSSIHNAETILPGGLADHGAATTGPFARLPVQFGRYRVESLLGMGAMGSVYRAHDSQLDRPVALKVPHLTGGDPADSIHRLIREAKAAANLAHQHICRVYDTAVENGTFFIAMEYIDGRPLSTFISSNKLQDERRCVNVVRKLAAALTEAHDKGVVHRDLKPANILVNARGEPVITDFGLARWTDAQRDSQATQAGMLVGSPAYMSPEQANGENDKIGPWTDIYSLGVVLFELLTGRTPFQGPVLTVLAQVATSVPPAPSSLRPGLNPRLDMICGRMMARLPADRPASMAEVSKELTNWLKSEAADGAGDGTADQPHGQLNSAARDAAGLQLASAEPAEAKRSVSPTSAVKSPDAKILDDVARQEKQARRWLEEHNYDAAIAALTKLSELPKTMSPQTAAWARAELPQAKEKRQKMHERIAKACTKARDLLQKHDYDGAATALDAIPAAARTEDARQLLSEAKEKDEECVGLRLEIDEALSRKKFERLLPLVQRLLKLKPDSQKFARLARNLASNNPARAVRAYKGTVKYFDVAGRLVEPKEIIGSVALILAIFGGMTFAVHSYLAGSRESGRSTATDAAGPSVANDSVTEVPKPAAAPKPVSNIPAGAVLVMNFEKATFFERDGKTFVRDLSGRGNDGLCDDVGFTAEGKAGGGLACGEGGLRLDKTLVNQQSNYTIALWCRLSDDFGRAGPSSLYALSEQGGPKSPLFFVTITPDRSLDVGAWNQGYKPDSWVGARTDAGTVPDQRWFFLALSLQDGALGTGKLSVTIDDRRSSFASQMVESVQTKKVDQIGLALAGAVIDELAVFQRALSEDEITAMRTLGMKGTPLDPGGASPALAATSGGTTTSLAFQRPGFDEWVKETAALSVEKQVEAVVKKLRELNPDFDGKVASSGWSGPPTIEDGQVSDFGIMVDQVVDISPVAALKGLKRLLIAGSAADKGRVSDLSPLQNLRLTHLNVRWTRVRGLGPLKGMPLEELRCGHNEISDLLPLRGMKLTALDVRHTLVADLAPVQGMKLTWLDCRGTPISTLAPLAGMPLTELICWDTNISDLSPLAGMKLSLLHFRGTKVSELAPLRGMPLTSLKFDGTPVSDLSPLAGMKLSEFHCGGTKISDLSALTGMPLVELDFMGTNVSDLSPLRGMNLELLFFSPEKITIGLDAVRKMKSMKSIGNGWEPQSRWPAAEFWKKYDAGEFGKPTAALDDAVQKDVKALQGNSRQL